MKLFNTLPLMTCAMLGLEGVVAVPHQHHNFGVDRVRRIRRQNTTFSQNLNQTSTTTSAAATSTSSGNVDILLAANVQDASDSTGQVGVIAAGQVESLTDPANFINFCTGKTLTNGLQVKSGSCNGIVMGEIPASDKMISTVIAFPVAGSKISTNETFTIIVRTNNLAAGSFTNAAKTYYAAPQKLNADGIIIGHTHVTVQPIEEGDNAQPPAPDTFSFFKGINTVANSNGELTAEVPGGLPAGNYRLCTMTSSSNHQPVLMPVAQRGAQDDCVRFTVSGVSSNSTSTAGNSSSTTTSDLTSATTSQTASGTTEEGSATTSDGATATSTGTATSTDASPTATSSSDCNNVQEFTGSLGGTPVAVCKVDSDRPFVVNGNSFINFGAACQRSCDIQHNSCANTANAGGQSFTVSDCDTQDTTCASQCFSTSVSSASASSTNSASATTFTESAISTDIAATTATSTSVSASNIVAINSGNVSKESTNNGSSGSDSSASDSTSDSSVSLSGSTVQTESGKQVAKTSVKGKRECKSHRRHKHKHGNNSTITSNSTGITNSTIAARWKKGPAKAVLF